jgi:hypothetical protein
MSEPLRFEPYRGLVIPRAQFENLLPIWPGVIRRSYEKQLQSTKPAWLRSADGLLHIEGDDVVIRTGCPDVLLALIAQGGISAPQIQFAYYPLPEVAPPATPERFLSRTIHDHAAHCFKTGEFVVRNVEEQIEIALEVVARWGNVVCIVAGSKELQNRVANAITQRYSNCYHTYVTPIVSGVTPRFPPLPAVVLTHAFHHPDFQSIPVAVVLAGPNGLTRQIRRSLARLHHARLYLVRLAESLGRDDDDEYAQLTVGCRLSEPSHPDSSRTYLVIRYPSAHCPDVELEHSAKPLRIWNNDARNAAIVKLARWLQRNRALPAEGGMAQVAVLVESDVHANRLTTLLAPTNGAITVRVIKLSDLKLSSPDVRAVTHLINAIGGPPSACLERFLNRVVLLHRSISLLDVSTPADARFIRARVASYRRAGLASEPRARSAHPAEGS